MLSNREEAALAIYKRKEAMKPQKEEILRKSGFGREVNFAKEGKCPSCRRPVKRSDLRDYASQKEFDASCLCQKCQDETLGSF